MMEANLLVKPKVEATRRRMALQIAARLRMALQMTARQMAPQKMARKNSNRLKVVEIGKKVKPHIDTLHYKHQQKNT
jgi:hypothetical protein